MEAYTTLAALATQTSRVKLGTLVTGVTYRNPAVLVKTVTTLDVISKGRAILGIGAAWNEDEHRGYGLEFPPIGRRMDRLDEALTIAKLMFTQDRPSFEGKYYKIDRALNVPRPVQAGGPKILIGGSGEQRTLRLLAQHGDIGHWFAAEIPELQRKKQIFYEHCEAVKRDPSEVQLTLGVTLGRSHPGATGDGDDCDRAPGGRDHRQVHGCGIWRLHVQQQRPADRRVDRAGGRADQSRARQRGARIAS